MSSDKRIFKKNYSICDKNQFTKKKYSILILKNNKKMSSAKNTEQKKY